MEFEFRPDGRLRYANNSNYKNDVMIRKEGTSLDDSVKCSGYALTPSAGRVGPMVMETLKKIIADSEILK